MLTVCIYQPWASLVMIGAKPWEFRDKSYLDRAAYRLRPKPGDRIMIHATARKMRRAEIADLLNKLDDPDGDHTGLDRDKAKPLLQRIWKRPQRDFQMLPLGGGLGTAIIGEPVLSCDLFKLKVSDSDRGQFNWAWPLTDVQQFAAPILMRGQQGFWNWPEARAA